MSTAGFSNHFDQWCDVLPETNKENPNLGCQKHKKTLVVCFQFDARDAKWRTLPRYTKENGEQGGENIVKGLSKCAYTKHFFFLSFTKWMVSSRVLPSKSCSACLCVFWKTITLLGVFLVFRDADLFPRNPVLFLFYFARKTEFISSYMSISRMPCLS